MITFEKIDNLLILTYQPINETDWIKEIFQDNEVLNLKNTFYFVETDLYGEIQEHEVSFIVAKLEGEYYKFDKDYLDLRLDVYINKNINIEKEFFIAYNNISIFSKIDLLISENEQEIRIGTSPQDNLPFDVFQKLIQGFPTTTEIDHYKRMRMDVVIKNYLETKNDYEEKYKKYMNKKASEIGEDIYDVFDDYEIEKYQRILDKLNLMLKNEDKYSEGQWQKEILQIIRLIYPKYIAVFENVLVRDVYTPTNRFLDFMLVDANGNIDIVEIKKPFGNKGIVTSTLYRDNHVPLRELSGSVMQIEKYIFYLNKWGKSGEDALIKKYAPDLPKDFEIKITNPGALIIMGRDHSMNSKQMEDFEIIKRKYKNVIDILTYDDLVRRLENTIEMFRK